MLDLKNEAQPRDDDGDDTFADTNEPQAKFSLGGLLSRVPEGARIPAWHGLVRYDQGRNEMIAAFILLALVLRMAWAVWVWIKVGNTHVPIEPRESFYDGYETGRREEREEAPDDLKRLRAAAEQEYRLAQDTLRAYGQYRIARNVAFEALNAANAWRSARIPNLPFPEARVQRALKAIGAVEVNDGPAITAAMQEVREKVIVDKSVDHELASVLYGRRYGVDWEYVANVTETVAAPDVARQEDFAGSSLRRPCATEYETIGTESGDDAPKRQDFIGAVRHWEDNAATGPRFDRGPDAAECLDPPAAADAAPSSDAG